MQIGTMLPVGGSNLDQFLDLVKKAELAGYASAWLANTSSLDALTALALAGRETERIELGTGIVPTYPRHPAALAQQALTVQAAIHGRLALGIGLSHRVVIEDRLGLDYSKPIPHTREYLTVLNGLLAGETVNFKGELYRVNMQLTLPGVPKPQVLVAALGPDMLRLCGRLADGTVTWMGGLNYLREVAVPTITRAAAKAGRPSPRIVAALPLCLTDDAEAARTFANSAFEGYGRLPSYRATLDRGGAEGPGDVAVVGTEEQIEAQLLAFERAGVTDFVAAVFHLPGGSDEPGYELMAAFANDRARGAAAG